jgi:hypothetical protein
MVWEAKPITYSGICLLTVWSKGGIGHKADRANVGGELQHVGQLLAQASCQGVT